MVGVKQQSNNNNYLIVDRGSYNRGVWAKVKAAIKDYLLLSSYKRSNK